MSALGSAIEIIAAKARGRRLSRAIASQTPAISPVAVYFADAPQSLYQLRRWYRVLESLDASYPTSIITSDPFTYATVRRETTVDVTFATGALQLARVLERQQVRVVLYPNHNALNFRMLRFARPLHVFIGHGESSKESSVSRQLKAYDLDFVADKASIEQLRGIRGYDAEASAVVIGSPWLGFLDSPPASWKPDDRTVVLYAPTWEGDRPGMDYSSVEALGDAIVGAVLGSQGLRLIYRPHPWLGRVRPASAAADARLRRTIAAVNRGDLVDVGPYGWALAVADVCVTDVSSVAHDIDALGKPLLIASRFDQTDEAGIRALIEQAVTTTESATVTPSSAMDGLLTAIGRALESAD
jgi:CDP-Glycerol:Poly(glycerophosphate) glycerophosphotransferase